MKKICVILACLLAVSMLTLSFASCEKDKDDKEIEIADKEDTDKVEYNDDDPDNGYSDLYNPDGK